MKKTLASVQDFSDKDYEIAGAKIVASAEELYGVSDVICKVKEPQESEYDLLRPEHVLFGYLHLASNLQLTKKLLEKKLTAITTRNDNERWDISVARSYVENCWKSCNSKRYAISRI